MNAPPSEKPPHSSAIPRFSLNRSVQIRPKSCCEFIQVIPTQALNKKHYMDVAAVDGACVVTIGISKTISE